MAEIKIKESARIKYQSTTWQGNVEINGESIEYRWSEDDNGAELYVFTKGDGWNEVQTDEGNYAVLYTAIMEWGDPTEFGEDGEVIEIDDIMIGEY